MSFEISLSHNFLGGPRQNKTGTLEFSLIIPNHRKVNILRHRQEQTQRAAEQSPLPQKEIILPGQSVFLSQTYVGLVCHKGGCIQIEAAVNYIYV